MAGGTGKIVHQMRVASTTLVDYKTVTGDATAHVKGAYTELVASLADAVQFIKLMWHNSFLTGGDSSMLLDLAVGAAGSEVVKVPNVQVGFAYSAIAAGGGRPARVLELPLAIPSGSRVAARIQGAQVSDTVGVACDFYGGFPAAVGEPADTIDTLGANTATSTGVQLTSGAVAHTKGLWTEIEDSTPNAYKALAVSVGGDAAIANQLCFLDIGAGALASEVALVSDIFFETGTTLETIGTSIDFGVFPLENALAAGSRLVARIQTNQVANDDVRVIVHGIK